RHLRVRINELMANIRKNEHSVVSKHRLSENHDFDWDKPTILHRETHKIKREIAEMIYIRKHSNCINLQTDTENLSDMYDNILKLS
ncbi:hypothetical protein X777_16229, partial [Ooceraea biroi]